jgi:hypothetical protein
MSKSNKRGQGRPMAEIVGIHTAIEGIISKRDIVKANKGNCTPLTAQKHMDWDMFVHAKNKKGEEIGFPHVEKDQPRRNSVLVCLKITAPPKNRKGLGRKQYLYANRTWLAANPDAIEKFIAANPTAQTAPAKKTVAKATRKTRKGKVLNAAKTSKVTVPVNDTPTADALEAQKTALGLNAPATVPAVEITPASEPAPVEVPAAPVETPAPEAVAAETAAVAETATAAVS